MIRTRNLNALITIELVAINHIVAVQIVVSEYRRIRMSVGNDTTYFQKLGLQNTSSVSPGYIRFPQLVLAKTVIGAVDFLLDRRISILYPQSLLEKTMSFRVGYKFDILLPRSERGISTPQLQSSWWLSNILLPSRLAYRNMGASE